MSMSSKWITGIIGLMLGLLLSPFSWRTPTVAADGSVPVHTERTSSQIETTLKNPFLFAHHFRRFVLTLESVSADFERFRHALENIGFQGFLGVVFFLGSVKALEGHRKSKKRKIEGRRKRSRPQKVKETSTRRKRGKNVKV